MFAACGKMPSSKLERAEEAYLYVRAPLDLLTPDWIQKTGFNRDHARHNTYALGYLDRKSYDALPDTQRRQLIELPEFDVATGAYNPFTLETVAQVQGVAAEDYHNDAALREELTNLASKFPHLANLSSIGNSVKGRPLWLMRVANFEGGAANKPKMLYIANMHGDEVVGRELMIYFIRKLLNGYGQDERVTNLLDHAEVFVIPSMNPDGFEMRRRASAAGLDLNRNFPDFTSDPNDTPSGRGTETKLIMALHDEHHFIAAINFHGGEVCFNLPWDTKSNHKDKFGDDALLSTLGRQYTKSNPTMYANDGGVFNHGMNYGFEWYEVDGGMQDWAIYYRQSMHATVELSYAKWPAATQLPKSWQENEESLFRFVESSLHGIHLEVVDADDQPVANVSVNISSAQRAVKYPGHIIHRPTLPGTQRVTISAPGFNLATVELKPSVANGVLEKIRLEKK
jgi:carboxypeptidase D